MGRNRRPEHAAQSRISAPGQRRFVVAARLLDAKAPCQQPPRRHQHAAPARCLDERPARAIRHHARQLRRGQPQIEVVQHESAADGVEPPALEWQRLGGGAVECDPVSDAADLRPPTRHIQRGFGNIDRVHQRAVGREQAGDEARAAAKVEHAPACQIAKVLQHAIDLGWKAEIGQPRHRPVVPVRRGDAIEFGIARLVSALPGIPEGGFAREFGFEIHCYPPAPRPRVFQK